ncbi:hypothetical protein DAEQUDRAFT_35214 [Daedalea quercina L-15889]|uniref:Uncharacterized protein n=1 Tax=Daedalea quercina L-15889 TaxID=1314783 RepID=A0A165SSI6_9APHY|nr:hypothetical protein DAEQUDRAFT_35214 [Daedalea quercina L-15889]
MYKRIERPRKLRLRSRKLRRQLWTRAASLGDRLVLFYTSEPRRRLWKSPRHGPSSRDLLLLYELPLACCPHISTSMLILTICHTNHTSNFELVTAVEIWAFPTKILHTPNL